MFDTLSGLREAMVGVAERFEPGLLSADDAAVAVAEATAIEHMAATVKSLAAARLAATDRWRATGDASPEEWLARQTGTSKSQAQAAIRTGSRLERLPEVAGAARAGTLSPGQAAEITEAASADPAAEHRLVQLARSKASVGELRDECRRTRAAADPDPEATARRIHRSRSLREFTDSEGAWNLHLRNTVEVGATVRAALQPFTDQAVADARRDGRREGHEAYAADAFTALCRRSTSAAQRPAAPATGGPAESNGAGEAAGTDAPDSGEAPAPKPPPYLGILRLDVIALQRGRAEGDEVVEIAGLGPVPVTRARELLSDAVLKLVITKGVDVVNVTHLGRGPTVAQKVALLWSSPGCTVHGCSRTRRLETDHRRPYAERRVTELTDLDRLCQHHHDKKTYEGWALVEGTGKREMVAPDDPRHPRHGPPSDGAVGPPASPPPDQTTSPVSSSGRAGPPPGHGRRSGSDTSGPKAELALGRPDAA
jgi:hypothetical protein